MARQVRSYQSDNSRIRSPRDIATGGGRKQIPITVTRVVKSRSFAAPTKMKVSDSQATVTPMMRKIMSKEVPAPDFNTPMRGPNMTHDTNSRKKFPRGQAVRGRMPTLRTVPIS